ncbi:hypothetical protein Tco_0242073 [Tanacetum coccineum]
MTAGGRTEGMHMRRDEMGGRDLGRQEGRCMKWDCGGGGRWRWGREEGGTGVMWEFRGAEGATTDDRWGADVDGGGGGRRRERKERWDEKEERTGEGGGMGAGEGEGRKGGGGDARGGRERREGEMNRIEREGEGRMG